MLNWHPKVKSGSLIIIVFIGLVYTQLASKTINVLFYFLEIDVTPNDKWVPLDVRYTHYPNIRFNAAFAFFSILFFLLYRKSSLSPTVLKNALFLTLWCVFALVLPYTVFLLNAF